MPTMDKYVGDYLYHEGGVTIHKIWEAATRRAPAHTSSTDARRRAVPS